MELVESCWLMVERFGATCRVGQSADVVRAALARALQRFCRDAGARLAGGIDPCKTLGIKVRWASLGLVGPKSFTICDLRIARGHSRAFTWFHTISHPFTWFKKKYENRRQEPGASIGICDLRYRGAGCRVRTWRTAPELATRCELGQLALRPCAVANGSKLHSFTQFKQSSTISNDVQRFWA